MAFDSKGHLWSVNSLGNSLTELNAKSGKTLKTITDGISGPTRLAFDSHGRIYVANTTGNTITEYAASGTLLRTFSGSFIERPLGVAVDADGNVYVANNSLNNIVVMNSRGVLRETLTEDNSGFSFTAPGALAINGQDLYIGCGAQPGENAVISYNVTEFLDNNPTEQVVFTNPTNTGPTGIAFDNAGNVYVTDYYSNTWVQYNSSGVLQFAVSSPETSPEGIAWDAATGDIYIGATAIDNIAIFSSMGNFDKYLFRL
jgi:sugar lactone lactonase YvrE